MSKLTYWKMEDCDGNNCYSLRFKTKREALAVWESFAPVYDESHSDSYGSLVEGVRRGTGEYGGCYGAPNRVTVTYFDGAFDLMDVLTGEGSSSY